MARERRSVRPGFIVGLVFIVIFLLALILDWWEEHTTIGWTILGILVALFMFSLYKFPKFRSWVVRKSISVGKKVVYEDSTPAREPIPPSLYNKVMHRANYHCENPDCKNKTKPEIHHINKNNSDHRIWNLIALCPNCHKEAHNTDKFSHSQLRNFVRDSYNRQRGLKRGKPLQKLSS